MLHVGGRAADGDGGTNGGEKSDAGCVMLLDGIGVGGFEGGLMFGGRRTCEGKVEVKKVFGSIW